MQVYFRAPTMGSVFGKFIICSAVGGRRVQRAQRVHQLDIFIVAVLKLKIMYINFMQMLFWILTGEYGNDFFYTTYVNYSNKSLSSLNVVFSVAASKIKPGMSVFCRCELRWYGNSVIILRLCLTLKMKQCV